MIVLVTGFSLVATILSFMSYEYFTFRKRTLSTISGLAQVVRLNSQAALSSGDTMAIHQSVVALGGIPEVQQASIFNTPNEIYATYEQLTPEIEMPAVQFLRRGHQFHDHFADYFEPIVHNGQTLGTLFVRYRLDESSARIRHYGLICLAIIVIGFPFLILFSYRLNRHLCRPIVELAAVSRRVSDAQDYSIRLPKHGDDEIGRMIDGFNHMLTEVEKRETDLVNMLENLDEGVLSIDIEGRIHGIHSGRVYEFFPDCLEEAETIGDLFRADARQRSLFKRWLKLARQPRFLKNWKSHQKLNPFLELQRHINGNEQILSSSWRPVVVKGRLRQIMVLIKDITEQRRSRDVLAETRREQDALLERVTAFIGNERAEVKEFLESAYNLARRVTSLATVEDFENNLIDVKRDLHTLKGNAGTIGFNKLSTIAGELEDVFEADPQSASGNLFTNCLVKLAVFQTELQRIVKLQKKLFLDDDGRMYVDRQRYQQLVADLKSGELMVLDDIYKVAQSLDSHPFSIYCRKYKRLVSNYRIRYQKLIKDLVIETPDTLVHRDIMRLLEPSIIHLVRNALDHGIESDAERHRLGKGAGNVRIGFHATNDLVRISITDDGKGIDGEKMAELAVQRNLMTPDEASRLSAREKVELILRPGFTTSEKVNSISGRGIGMDAVIAYMNKIGGMLEIFTRVGKGTRMTLRLPLNNGHLMSAARSGLDNAAQGSETSIGEWAEQASVSFVPENERTNSK